MTRYENNAISTFVQAGDLSAAATNLFRAAVQLPEKILTTLYVWQTRSEDRKILRELSDHQLKDIGIDRVAALGEANKPIWRA